MNHFLGDSRPSNRHSLGSVRGTTKTQLALLAALWILGGIAFADEPKQADKQDDKPKTVVQADDGTVLLHARDVTIHGTTVRYEAQPNKNTVGYWTKADDWISWDLEVTKPGKFSVEILQGCGKGSGGAEVEFAVGEQTLKVKVEETGGFQNFVARDIGAYTLDKPGKYTLTVKPKTKPGPAVMDLRQITLKPAK